MYFLYKFLTYFFYPFAPIYLYFRIFRKKEDPTRYVEKLAKINTPREKGFLIWFHVASIGEAMSILPLIDYYAKQEKINKILITSITLSSGKVLRKRFNQNSKVIHQFLPLDVTTYTSKFLKHWKPNLSIFVDSEIWPNLIIEIKKKSIPLLLINARITKKSFLRWKLISNFAKKVFEKFDLCIASNKETENFLTILGAKNIKNYGNIKFSNIKNDANKKLDLNFLDKIKDRKIWCAASTHPTEEILCANSHLKIKKNYSNVLTIIIPRHINRVKNIKDELLNLNLKIALSSKLEDLKVETDILIVDSYGEAVKFYNISRCAFLGKSLVKSLINNSGQNPIEPARLGCKILHGPYVNNFIEIYDYLKTLNITKKVNDVEELSQALVEEFKIDRIKDQETTKKIEIYGQNIFNNVIIELKKYISS
jgi:3-deoxy-D-manno-octulosonic-acid transferase